MGDKEATVSAHNWTQQICVVYTDADPGRFENLQQQLEAPKRCPTTTMGSKLFVWGSSRVDSRGCAGTSGYDTHRGLNLADEPLSESDLGFFKNRPQVKSKILIHARRVSWSWDRSRREWPPCHPSGIENFYPCRLWAGGVATMPPSRIEFYSSQIPCDHLFCLWGFGTNHSRPRSNRFLNLAKSLLSRG